MIVRFRPEDLRKLADQCEAYTALVAAGAELPSSNTVLRVNGAALAYLHWWDDKQSFMAELISFTPDGAEPLVYHEAGK